ncbi:MAG TPA: CHAT domain-containing protein, partial [Gemmatimonadales bacterium]|nr:CHAT domain-containing protein [Gemmatimonadales bacterium]
VSTLWQIDDSGAAEFAEQFYSRLVTNTVADAFAQAQRTLAGGGRFNNPYYWAGYLLSGGGEPFRRATSILAHPESGALPSFHPFRKNNR